MNIELEPLRVRILARGPPVWHLSCSLMDRNLLKVFSNAVNTSKRSCCSWTHKTRLHMFLSDAALEKLVTLSYLEMAVNISCKLLINASSRRIYNWRTGKWLWYPSLWDETTFDLSKCQKAEKNGRELYIFFLCFIVLFAYCFLQTQLRIINNYTFCLSQLYSPWLCHFV